MSDFYLTTAIDYSNGEPHIGHAYEKIGADAIARYRRLRGDDVHFLIGMDEHGQKVAQAAAQESEWLDGSVAVLQGLDKVNARISSIEAPRDKPVRFGTLEIVMRACKKRPPVDPPESAAFLEIRDLRQPDAPAIVFSGWMFASSPALSALEHPIYDVWVLDCKNVSKSDAPKP